MLELTLMDITLTDLNLTANLEDQIRIRNQFIEGLEIDRLNWLGVSEVTKDTLASIIAENTANISNILKIPDVSFSFLKNSEQSSHGGKILHNAKVDQDHSGKFVVKFRAGFIKNIASGLAVPDSFVESKYQLIWVLAHELYHVREISKWPHSVVRDILKYQNSKTEEEYWHNYLLSKAEYGSELFAYAYLQAELKSEGDGFLGDVVKRQIIDIYTKQISRERDNRQANLIFKNAA